MIKISYLNGSYNRANKVDPENLGQVGNAIIMASNEGWPYRGKPEDMARDAICHINKQLGFEISVFPVILSSKTIVKDLDKFYTTEIVFQAVV